MAVQISDLGHRPDRGSAQRAEYAFDCDKYPDAVPLGKFAVYEPNPQFHACAASAIAAAIELCPQPHGWQRFTPSVGFIYYIGRFLQGRERENSGASIYATLRACMAIGFCPEPAWSTRDRAFDESPLPATYDEADVNGVLEFRHLERKLDKLKCCLKKGFPFIFGLLVDQDFLTPADPTFAQPIQAPATSIVDRHCLLAVADDEANQAFVVRDSLGRNRGDEGYIRLAYDYVTNGVFASDFWVVTDVGGGAQDKTTLDQKRRQYEDEAVEFSNQVAQARAALVAAAAQPGVAGTVAAALPPIARRIRERLTVQSTI
jgi:hypothetical protein